jgi:hypothetical protein
MKKNILIKVGLLAGAFLLFSSFRKKKLVGGIPLISQVDAPTGTEEVYSKVGTQLFDVNKNVIFTYDYAGAGMTVTGFKNGVYSVVYGDSFTFGLPAYVLAKDVITN